MLSSLILHIEKFITLSPKKRCGKEIYKKVYINMHKEYYISKLFLCYMYHIEMLLLKKFFSCRVFIQMYNNINSRIIGNSKAVTDEMKVLLMSSVNHVVQLQTNMINIGESLLSS